VVPFSFLISVFFFWAAELSLSVASFAFSSTTYFSLSRLYILCSNCLFFLIWFSWSSSNLLILPPNYSRYSISLFLCWRSALKHLSRSLTSRFLDDFRFPGSGRLYDINISYICYTALSNSLFSETLLS